MKTELWLIGKNDKIIMDGFALYAKRLKHYLPFEAKVIADSKYKNQSEGEIKISEGKIILGKLDPQDHLVLLDERGKSFSSEHFAGWMGRHMVSATRKIIFLIGGAYGFDKKVYERANESLSLSKMTLAHQIARIVFMEQLYRAFTIINHEPYHHE